MVTSKFSAPPEISALRKAMKLSQVEFGQLFDAHFMTISKWERGISMPSAYQLALMERFRQKMEAEKATATEELKQLLIGAGAVAALIWLVSSAK